MKKAGAKKSEVKKAKKVEEKPEVDVTEAPAEIKLLINEQTIIGKAGSFSTGSRGWKAFGKVDIAGMRCQVSCNIVIIGSKPKEEKSGK